MNICVFCSSRNDIAEHYKQTAYKLGEYIATSGNVLVYGGATGGLMSAVSESAANKNGRIIGVIAEPIINMNRQSLLPMEMVSVKDLAERKTKMKEISDLFIVLPGGYGTMDEMFDVIASGSVGEHSKPLVLVNQNHFYDSLLNQIQHMHHEKCILDNERYAPSSVQHIEQCIELIHHLQNQK